MGLKELKLSAEYTYIQQKRFNSESWCISELYWSFLKNYNTERVTKCTIVAVANPPTEETNVNDSIRNSRSVNIPFDFIVYFNSSNILKKRLQLDAIHSGMLMIANKEGWVLDTLFSAYNSCISCNLNYNSFINKSFKASPNKIYYFNIWFEWEIDFCKLYWVLHDNKKKELSRNLFYKTAPYHGEYIYYLSCSWLDNRTVSIENNYKYGNKEIWIIEI